MGEVKQAGEQREQGDQIVPNVMTIVSDLIQHECTTLVFNSGDWILRVLEHPEMFLLLNLRVSQ